jgi:SH3 domain protein
MIKYLLIFLSISTLAFKLSAQEVVEGEILYITDELRLSLYEDANQRSKILQYLSSGERLEVSQNSGPYAFVITESGKKGWVKRGFLVSKLPTITLLEQEQEKTEALVQELNKLANSSQVIDQYEKDMDALSNQLKAETEAKEAVEAQIEGIKQQAEEKQKKADLVVKASQHKAEPLDVLITITLGYWRYLLPLCFGFILIGFIIAKQMLEARIKKKFQGIKVW